MSIPLKSAHVSCRVPRRATQVVRHMPEPLTRTNRGPHYQERLWLGNLITFSQEAQSFAYRNSCRFFVFIWVRFFRLLLALQQAQVYRKHNSYTSSIAF
jgi:hypothetical protein